MVEGQLDALAGGGGEQAVAAAAERLGVVGGQGPPGERDGQLVKRRRASDDPLALGCGPALAGDSQGSQAIAEVSGSSLLRLGHQLLLDTATRDGFTLGQGFFEPLHHCPQLELAHEVPQSAPVGL